FHHQLVDTRGITMHWSGKPTTTTTTDVVGVLLESGWVFTDARGHRIGLPAPVGPVPGHGLPDDQPDDPAGTPPAAAA
ncbi:hypothetical protein, partial [Promicromonospora kroppenstedtii]|uniref:hypothetical protein n=1 Tax=Promicromonospora kroppenstedtii TaxID=440482 RepID=UPI00055A861E